MTSITVSRETLRLANRVKAWKQYADGKKYSLDGALNKLLVEEIERIEGG